MAKINNKIKVKEVNTGSELFSCSLEQEEEAFRVAKEMESLGIEVEVINPGISQTLASGLGVREEEWREYYQSMENEINDHH